jgi:hypothetical protein
MQSYRMRSDKAGGAFAVTIVLAAAAWSAAAQRLPASQAPAFRADATLVLVPVAVVDRRGAVVNGLARDAFTLTEDGVRQQIRSFSEEDAPVSMGIVLDLSGSMRGVLGVAKESLRALVKDVNPADERGCLAGVAAVVLLTFCAFRLHLNLSTSVPRGSLYFLIVVMVAVVWGFWEASVTSLIAVNCLNYFFVPPVLTWRVSDPQNWVALATFEITALTVSRLSTRAQSQARAEARQRAEVEKLYELSRRILFLDRRQRSGRRSCPHSGDLPDGIRGPVRRRAGAPGCDRFRGKRSRTTRAQRLFPGQHSGRADAHTWAHVLRLGSRPVGAIAIRGPEVGRLAIVSIASLAAIALERARSFEKESRAEAARQTEQLRTAVLDSLAHAFKTPLTAIRTASSGLLEAGRLSTDDTNWPHSSTSRRSI